jgi:hypothetical protein
VSSGWPLGSTRPRRNWIHHAAFVRLASCLLAPRPVVLASACHSSQLQSLARSGIVAPNNSFKPKPLRGSATPCGFSGGFGLTQALALMKNSAVISDCEQYRYELRRVWDESAPLVLFIGLNPSTADGSSDDNTSRVCIKSGGAMAVFCLATCLPTARPTSLLLHCARSGWPRERCSSQKASVAS